MADPEPIETDKGSTMTVNMQTHGLHKVVAMKATGKPWRCIMNFYHQCVNPAGAAGQKISDALNYKWRAA